MKVMTIFGTRPEIIRLSEIIKKLDEVLGEDHIKVYTNQNFESNLSEIFLDEFDIKPRILWSYEKHTKFLTQFPSLCSRIGNCLKQHRPDKVLILGDTNSGLAAAIMSEKLGISVYHMEAGNRCYDLSVPEEKNRILIDSISTFNLPYTPRARENLILEGFPKQRIFQCGNPIREVMEASGFLYKKPDISHWSLNKIVEPERFMLVTMHRQENHSSAIIERFIDECFESYTGKIFFIVHPRIKDDLEKDIIPFFSYEKRNRIYFSEPMNHQKFLGLLFNAEIVVTDSGTVPEEVMLHELSNHRPVVIARSTTERPEIVEAGFAVVSGKRWNSEISVADSIKFCLSVDETNLSSRDIPEGYYDMTVSERVTGFLLSEGFNGYKF